MTAMFLALSCLDGVAAQRAAELAVVGDHAERRLVARWVYFGLVADGEICGMPASW